MTAGQRIDCWAFFEKIYCITVAERTDRRQEASAQFKKVGLDARVEFVTVRKHARNPEQGIFESHLACLKRGLDAGAANILIFEDDVIFDRFNHQRLEQGIDFLSTRPDWKALFLGCLVSSSKRTANRSVLKIDYRCLTHAYAVNRGFAASLAKLRWQQEPYDVTLRRFTPDGFYVIQPSFAFQSDSASDNDRLAKLDKFRRFLGGLRRIQKLNEYYHHHRLALVALHLLVIIISLAWILNWWILE